MTITRRADLFVRELSDEETAHLLNQVVLFASFQGQSVRQINSASATDKAALIHASNKEGPTAPNPRWGGLTAPDRSRRQGRDREVDLARPTDGREPLMSWSLSRLRAHLVRARIGAAMNRSQLWRIPHEAAVRVAHRKMWKASPEFQTKKNRILDLPARPPVDAPVPCLDESGPLNVQPRLGRGWHRLMKSARFPATHRWTVGVRQLVAAYDPAAGAVYGPLHDPQYLA